MTSDPQIELSEGYYLDNLEHVIAHALERYEHLLEPDAAAVLRRFGELSRDARRLYARLYLRVGPVFRRSALRYGEIHVEAAIAELEAERLVRRLDVPLEPEAARELLPLFTAAELAGAAAASGLRVKGRKADLVEAVSALPEALAALRATDTLVERLCDDLFRLAQLLFFGNRSQDLSEFVLVSLDRARYPDYEVARDLPLFSSREAVRAFLEAERLVAEELDPLDPEALAARAAAALGALAGCDAVAPHARRLHPGRLYARAAFACARELERLDCNAEAVAVYAEIIRLAPQAGLRGEAADRLGLAAARAGLPERFAECCAPLLADPALDAIARFRVESRAAALARAAGPAAALRQPPVVELELEAAGHAGSKALYLSASGEAVTIEAAALEALGGGLHAENALFRALFGLLFWEVVFAPVKGMFQHRFQTGPLDLASEHFYENRRELVAARLEELRGASLGREVAVAFESHRGLTNAFVGWELYTAEELVRAADAFGERLAPILERLARHPSRHGRGLPDLLVYEGGEPVLVEVKGPGDQPQIEQRLWHDALLAAGVDVRIARVRRQGTGIRADVQSRARPE